MSDSVKLEVTGDGVIFKTAEELDLFINEMISRRIEVFGSDLEVTATNSMEQEQLLGFLLHLIDEYNRNASGHEVKLFYGDPVPLH